MLLIFFLDMSSSSNFILASLFYSSFLIHFPFPSFLPLQPLRSPFEMFALESWRAISAELVDQLAF